MARRRRRDPRQRAKPAKAETLFGGSVHEHAAPRTGGTRGRCRLSARNSSAAGGARPDEIDVTNAERLCNLVDGYDRRISTPVFESADILLAKARHFGELLLRQVPLLPDSFDVPADEDAHVHAPKSPD